MHGAVAFGDPGAASTVHAYSIDLAEIGHRAKPLGDLANLCDRRDIAIHRINRLETNELRAPRIGADQTVFEVVRIVMADDLIFGATVPDALDHRGVVGGI